MIRKCFYPKLMVLFFSMWVFHSCDKDDSTTKQVTSDDINEIKAIVGSGGWHVSYFFDTDREETDNFAGYVFTFNVDGALTATDGNSALSGAWSVSSDNSNDDDANDVDFNILFNAPDDFEELSEDWHITAFNDNKIELNHVSGGNGGTDYLTFEKN